MRKIYSLLARPILLVVILLLNPPVSHAQPVGPTAYAGLRWRCIGPFRGGRTVGAVGVPSQPNIFYIGVNNGGLWKTTDFGRTWIPLFDKEPTGSIGDIAVSPSNPNVIYVGSGEGLQRPDLSVGDGIYKSVDAGKTWVHLGLSDAQQIGRLAVDPNDENRLFVAALGHPYGPNKERGVYRTLDGGRTWKQVLYIDENTGAAQVSIDPKNSQIIFADMWAGRQGPWENGEWEGPRSGLFKSTDGGNTWKKITRGLPGAENSLGRIGFAIAPSDPNRMYASVNAQGLGGIYRSDDAGESWTRIQSDHRLWGRGDDFAEMQVDPANPDIVYTANIVTWKSTDGGKTWNAFRGAPGGDDYHRIWINPDNPKIILIAADQGAIITVNGGQTFSSWYNQPTAQFYHVSTDNVFPYNVYGGQQESGSVGTSSRGNDGQITFREWHSVAAQEYGYVAADPLHPNIIYGGKLTRYNKLTGQSQNVSPELNRRGKYRFLRTAPVLFSPIDPKTLYYAGNVLFKTTNGGNTWDVISPDLTRSTWDIPPSVGIYSSESMKTMPRRGVIYTIAPSPRDINTIWAGTDDGLIQVTHDGGKHWKNVTPSSITSWSKISIMDAGHFNTATAYAAVNRIRCDDMHPHIYRTHDGGASWTEIVNGLPDEPINSVKEDPLRKGLLFAGSETAVFVSFDDGDHWQSLRQNMPATSVRDLVIKDNDLVIGTHGRGFWILDDISPLRQLALQNRLLSPTLFAPEPAIRVRWNMNTDTPLPPEEPAGENPPDGAILDYYLPGDATGEVTLDILTTDNHPVRHFSSLDQPPVIPPLNVPPYWIRPFVHLSAKKGHHRFIWDLHYQPLDRPAAFSIAAIYRNTAPEPTGPWVMPGKYLVRLSVNGKAYTQSIVVKMDPRVKNDLPAWKQQFDLSMECYKHRQELTPVLKQLRSPEGSLRTRLASATEEEKQNLNSLARMDGVLASLFNNLQDADQMPTQAMQTAEKEASARFQSLMAGWQKWKSGQP